MAEVNLNEKEVIEVNLIEEKPLKTELPDINYIPGYMQAEAERRAYYEDFKQRVDRGEFNGKDGETGKDGEAGAKGEKGDKGDKGEKGDTGEQGIQGIQGEAGADGSDYVLTEADKTEIANLVLASIPVAEEVSF